jgi:hypothetical protein
MKTKPNDRKRDGALPWPANKDIVTLRVYPLAFTLN